MGPMNDGKSIFKFCLVSQVTHAALNTFKH